jgi:hypothetical protein
VCSSDLAHLRVRLGQRAPAQPHAEVGAQCPQCGASLPFEAGRSVSHCPHCGASLVAGTAIMQQAMDVVRSDLRREAMERFRLERNATANVAGMSCSKSVPYIVLGSFLPMTLGGAIAFTASGEAPGQGLAALWAVALTNLGLLVAIYLFRKRRRDHWRGIADQVAERVAGSVTTSIHEWVGWLNHLWAGPYKPTKLMTGSYFHAVTGRLGAFAVAVDLDPVPISSEHAEYYQARTDVLLAAGLPGGTDSVELPPDLAQRAHRLGFVLSSCSGGLLAKGKAAVNKLRKGEVATGSHLLLATLALLAEWATRVGAAPVEVIE